MRPKSLLEIWPMLEVLRRIAAKKWALLRQGRKYGLGGCIATQRIAYLNSNALQQLHTYFVGILPRPYDRNLVSNTFTIDQWIPEKTLEFAPREWLLSSYIATGIDNVPIFIKADNVAEKEIESVLRSRWPFCLAVAYYVCMIVISNKT